MGWQTWAAIGLAAIGGLWTGWTLVEPFVRPSRADCGLCGLDSELLQIEPPNRPDDALGHPD